jgi:hypothetical protein
MGKFAALPRLSSHAASVSKSLPLLIVVPPLSVDPHLTYLSINGSDAWCMRGTGVTTASPQFTSLALTVCPDAYARFSHGY